MADGVNGRGITRTRLRCELPPSLRAMANKSARQASQRKRKRKRRRKRQRQRRKECR
jgi:hypothetical protein